MISFFKQNVGKKILHLIFPRIGEGIGKNADGIVKPVKASLKFDNAGLSYDRGKEFTDHWWETAFNNAANNLNVSINEENVSLSVHNEIEVKTHSSHLHSHN